MTPRREIPYSAQEWVQVEKLLPRRFRMTLAGLGLPLSAVVLTLALISLRFDSQYGGFGGGTYSLDLWSSTWPSLLFAGLLALLGAFHLLRANLQPDPPGMLQFRTGEICVLDSAGRVLLGWRRPGSDNFCPRHDLLAVELLDPWLVIQVSPQMTIKLPFPTGATLEQVREFRELFQSGTKEQWDLVNP